jgi:hypothetical protein
MKGKTPTTTETAPTSNMFEDMLRKHRRGVAANEASRRLQEAIQASRDTGAASEVTLKVKLRPGTDDQMQIDIQVANKLPKEKLPSGLFWVDDENRLHTSDPKQPELNLREVTKDAESIRDTKTA